MSRKRKYNAELKAKIALEAVKNQQTVNEIASYYQVHPAQVSTWKKELMDGIIEVFNSPSKNKNKEKEHSQEILALRGKIGELTMDIEWMKKKLPF